MKEMSEQLIEEDSVASVVSPRVLANTKEIDIPDVQRGLVWDPTQIVELWKSIFEGYPIGALTVYRQEDKWQLIDGQQRWHAIKLGLHPDEEQEAMTILWTVWEKKQDEPWNFVHLMVSTRRHPWGFVWNKPGDHLERLPHPKMIVAWDNMLPIKEREDSFELPTLEDAQDYLKDNSTHKWIPLHELLSKGDTPGDSDVQTIKWIPLHELLSEGDTPGDPDVQTIRSSAQVVTWRKRVDSAFIPLIRFNLQEDDLQENDSQENVKSDRNRIHELFTRINKGGTQISPVDYTYSTLCSYLGKYFKKGINEIAVDFLPPSRVARIYARLAYAAVKPETLKEPDTPAFWRTHKYEENISKAIGKAKELLKAAIIPASIYLSATSDEWLTVICWCMWKFGELAGSPADKKLLCMLPYVVCRGPEFHKAFCRKFHEVLRECDSPGEILHLVAIGTAYAACYSIETGMYPLSLPEKPTIMREYPYEDEWLYVLRNPKNEPLLHFLQRSYMCRMLKKKCGFYPHETATWGEDMNRPWDIDHIVPRSRWWLLQREEEMFRESLPNKQILYYRRNREKHDEYIGVPADDNIKPEDNFCYRDAVLREAKRKAEKVAYYGWDKADVFKEPRPVRLHRKTEDSHGTEYKEISLPIYKKVVNARFATMVQRLFEELPLEKLIKTINDLPQSTPAPPSLQLPIKLWSYLKERKDLTWCSVRHDESKQQIIATKDFYHSLCHWLAVGKEENHAFRCVCWHLTDAKNLHVETGRRRCPNQTVSEWRDGAPSGASLNDWWVEEKSFICNMNNVISIIEKYPAPSEQAPRGKE
ncbi:MAG: DUF262 domain-containing protein [Akkermansia sp.]|nr:DUF262 domain-containing protein [Akkermansia sp.]